MSRQVLRPVRVWTDSRWQPVCFIWREATYSGRVVNSWKLSDRWWDNDRFSDRTYYKLVARDHQAFDLFRDDSRDGLWILGRIHDYRVTSFA